MLSVSFIWCHYDQIYIILKIAICLCDTSRYPPDIDLLNDVSYTKIVHVDFKIRGVIQKFVDKCNKILKNRLIYFKVSKHYSQLY